RAAADGATLEPTQLGRDLIGQPVAGLEPDAAGTGRIVQRRGREGRTEGAEKVLRTRRPGDWQRIRSGSVVAGRIGARRRGGGLGAAERCRGGWIHYRRRNRHSRGILRGGRRQRDWIRRWSCTCCRRGRDRWRR